MSIEKDDVAEIVEINNKTYCWKGRFVGLIFSPATISMAAVVLCVIGAIWLRDQLFS
jgi:hypothetical protein